MLGRRSDAVPIKAARRAFGPLLVHQISPTALHVWLIKTESFGKKLVQAGEWRMVRRMSQHPVYQRMEQLVQYGRAYREMPVYASLLTQALKGTPHICNEVALNSETVLDVYFERYLQLIESIRRSGVLPRERLVASTDDPLVRLPTSEIIRLPGADDGPKDIRVAIGPNGELLQMGSGRHRTAIAQVLGLERIPVEIRLMHVEWLSKLVERSGKSPLDALLDWLNATKQHGLGSQTSDWVRPGGERGHLLPPQRREHQAPQERHGGERRGVAGDHAGYQITG